MAVQELRTLPNLQAEMGVPFRRLEQAVRRLNVEPALITNAQPWYSAEDVERIRAAVQGEAVSTPGEGGPQ